MADDRELMPPPPPPSVSSKVSSSLSSSLSNQIKFESNGSKIEEGIQAQCSTLPPTSNNSSAGKTRQKVVLKPGHSQWHWMKLQSSVSSKDMTGLTAATTPACTMAEVRKHNTAEDCWMVLHGMVYNVSAYMEYHPGGISELMRGAGDNATALFDEYHPWVNFQSMLSKCCIGPLVVDRDALTGPAALSMDIAKPFKVLSVVADGDQSVRIVFALPPNCSHLGIQAGQHIMVQASIEGSMVERAYTPISPPDQHNTFELAVKVYNNGKVSKYLGSIKVGEEVMIRGPLGAFCYSRACVRIGSKMNISVRYLAMIGGGSGITPMYQLTKSIVEDSSDPTVVLLISVNTTESSIMLKTEIEELRETHKDRMMTHFWLTKEAAASWTGIKGSVCMSSLRPLLPPPGSPGMVLVCGPQGFNDTVLALLQEIGFAQERIHVFQ